MALLPVEEALRRMLADVTPLETELTPIDQARGRVLSRPLAAKLTQPPFSASAMDGYAVKATDVATLPARLRIIGEAAAGHPFGGTVGTGEAVRIFTGAPIPEGADAIVIQENTARDGNAVTVREGTLDPGFVRRKGFDFTQGEELLAAGQRLGARTMALAAAMGHGRVPVHRRPRVAIISTGDELVLPGQVPGPGQIISSNHLAITALCLQAGAEAGFLGIARDTLENLRLHMGRADDADILVTIGGASVGDHDLVGPALKERGVDIDFWNIAMRPGKPLMFGRRPAASGRDVMQRCVGLPGNPVSAMICARVFLVPLIEALTGRAAEADRPATARASRDLEANGPRAHYMRALLGTNDKGERIAEPVRSQDSSLLSPLASADCLIVRPVGAPAAPAGTPVPVLMLDF